MLTEKEIRPYGDSYNDGKVQLSFTLPLAAGEEAKEAARQLVEKMNLTDVSIVDMKDLSQGFSFFVAYARSQVSVDPSTIRVQKVETATMDFQKINEFIEKEIKRKLIVVGACTGSDAHTVGLDAIMNMKGYAGEVGLERYPWLETYNLGSQVPNMDLIKKAIELAADVILVSQVVTQRGIHTTNLTQLVELLEAENLREKFILIAGGPRISHEFALELGFDAGFGVGTLPPDVASFIAQKMAERLF